MNDAFSLLLAEKRFCFVAIRALMSVKNVGELLIDNASSASVSKTAGAPLIS